MNIVVTGCAGFIGSHVVEKLLTLNHHVIGIDNFDDFYLVGIKERNILPSLKNENFRLYRKDIRDKNAIENIFRSAGSVHAVIHLAARAGVRPSIDDPILYSDVNIIGTNILLDAMRKYGIKKLVFASSSSVYGNNKKVPFSEYDPVDHPISPYAATKKAGELLCYTYYHLHGIEAFCLRFFTVYGPRQRPEMAITKFVDAIIHNKPISLFANGLSSRDYTYVQDIVSGVISALSNVSKFEIINIGNSSPINLLSLLGVIENSIGKKSRYNLLPAQVGDVDETYADISKASRILNYHPEYSIEKGILSFVNWYKQNNQ
jgi:UDP-glucuronate 4-epimerase